MPPHQKLFRTKLCRQVGCRVPQTCGGLRSLWAFPACGAWDAQLGSSPPLQSPCASPSSSPSSPPSLQHPSPGPGMSLVPAAARHCPWLQPRDDITHLKVRKSFGVITVLSPGSAFPPPHSLHQQENSLFLTLIKP